MNKLKRISVIFMSLIMLFAMTISVSAATDTSETPQYPEFKNNRITVEAEDCINSKSDMYFIVDATTISDYPGTLWIGSKALGNVQDAAAVIEGTVSAYDTGITLKGIVEGASGNKAVRATNAEGTLQTAVENIPSEPGLSYTFNAPEDGEYYVWVRGLSQEKNMGHFWFKMDSGTYTNQKGLDDEDGSGTYKWIKVYSGELTAGEHTINISARKAYPYIDKLLISNDKNLVPTGDGEARASVGDKYYSTLQEAIAAATASDTITLLEDVDLGETDIMLSYGTLDLNGQILTASSFTAFTGTDVVDNSTGKTGVLKATFAPAETNTQMPIYNGTGYVFIDFNGIKKQEQNNTVANSGVFDLIFRPSFGETNNASLAALGDAAQVSFRIRLKWTDENGENEQTKDLYYSDDLVKQVYGNKKAFSITASGVSNYHNLTITPLVQSKLNVKIEWLGSTYTANQ